MRTGLSKIRKFLKKDKTTDENRKFWAYVEKTAQEAKSGNWQKGAVARPAFIEMNMQQ